MPLVAQPAQGIQSYVYPQNVMYPLLMRPTNAAMMSQVGVDQAQHQHFAPRPVLCKCNLFFSMVMA